MPNIWIDGVPEKPWSKEWFIAVTIHGERVVLKALPEEYSYDFKTADDTYYKKDIIKKWMQFPDSNYIPFISVDSANEKLNEAIDLLDMIKVEIDESRPIKNSEEYVAFEANCYPDIEAFLKSCKIFEKIKL